MSSLHSKYWIFGSGAQSPFPSSCSPDTRHGCRRRRLWQCRMPTKENLAENRKCHLPLSSKGEMGFVLEVL